jgi:cyclopropane-fatty-acyl-phospholipid synthase
VTINDGSGRSEFGNDDGMSASVSVTNDRFYRKGLLGPLAIAESYIEGDWTCDDLTSLIRIFIKNRQSIDRSNSWKVKLSSFGHRLFHWFHANTRRGSLKNIGAHYDLGNEFYSLWLDETMAYSSGIFRQQSDSLKTASLEKFDRICRKLDLGADDNVLEIGTGFGGFAIHAAESYGCDVTTTTISEQQFQLAESRFKNSSAESQISLLKTDYRDLTGKFDKLVSIEMIEAVGHRFLDQYFQKCGSLLRNDGSMVLQAIVMPERNYQRYLNSVDFIRRYVFPGGNLPTLASMLDSAGRSSDLRMVHAEDLAPHYAETLKRWRVAFQSRLQDVLDQGYPQRFIRLWTFYLCYCEAAFAERQIGVLQVQFDKPGCLRDPIELTDHAAGGLRVSEVAAEAVSPCSKEERNSSKEYTNECC